MKLVRIILLLIVATGLSGCIEKDYEKVNRLIEKHKKSNNPIVTNIDRDDHSRFVMPSLNDAMDVKNLIQRCEKLLANYIYPDARKLVLLEELIALSQNGYVGIIERLILRDLGGENSAVDFFAIYGDQISRPFYYFSRPTQGTLELTSHLQDTIDVPSFENIYTLEAREDSSLGKVVANCMTIELQAAFVGYDTFSYRFAYNFMLLAGKTNIRSAQRRLQDLLREIQ